MLSKLAIRRLTKLADFMDALPPEARKHFDMGRWFKHNGMHKVKDEVSALRKFDCGTSACAAGWACAVPEFRRAGLTISGNDVLYDGYSAKDSFTALSVFFDIPMTGHLGYLFGNTDNIRTPKQWAKHCRKYIRDNAA